MVKSALWLEQNVGQRKSRLNVMRGIESYVVSIDHSSTTPNYLGFQQIVMMDGLAPRINVLDVDIEALANVIIATIAAMNTSLGMAQHSNKFNT